MFRSVDTRTVPLGTIPSASISCRVPWVARRPALELRKPANEIREPARGWYQGLPGPACLLGMIGDFPTALGWRPRRPHRLRRSGRGRHARRRPSPAAHTRRSVLDTLWLFSVAGGRATIRCEGRTRAWLFDGQALSLLLARVPAPSITQRRGCRGPRKFSGKTVVDLYVSRNGRTPVRRRVVPPRVPSAFTQQRAAMLAQMPQKLPTLHTTTVASS